MGELGSVTTQTRAAPVFSETKGTRLHGGCFLGALPRKQMIMIITVLTTTSY